MFLGSVVGDALDGEEEPLVVGQSTPSQVVLSRDAAAAAERYCSASRPFSARETL